MIKQHDQQRLFRPIVDLFDTCASQPVTQGVFLIVYVYATSSVASEREQTCITILFRVLPLLASSEWHVAGRLRTAQVTPKACVSTVLGSKVHHLLHNQ